VPQRGSSGPATEPPSASWIGPQLAHCKLADEASSRPDLLIVELRVLLELAGTVAGSSEPVHSTVAPGELLVDAQPMESVTATANVPEAVLLAELLS
jgi:hypothetical protein